MTTTQRSSPRDDDDVRKWAVALMTAIQFSPVAGPE